MRLPALLVAGVLLASLPAQAKVRVDRRGAKVNGLKAKDWLRHPHDDKTYQESWTAILRGDAGHILYVSFIYTNIGVLSGSSAVSVSVTRPGKKGQAFRFDHDVDAFSQKAGAGRIAIGPSSISLKGDRCRVVVKGKGLSLDVELKAWMPGVKLHTGRIWLDDDKTDWVETYFHVPRGDFVGSLTLGGKKEALSGAGYVDHLVQNVLGTTYSTHWWTLRHFAPDHTVAFLVWRTPKALGGRDVAHLLITDRERVLAFDSGLKLKPGKYAKDPKGHRYATRFGVSWKGGGMALKGDVTSQRLHERDAVLERLSWMERKVAGLVAGNPVMYRMEGGANLKLIRDGQEQTIGGTALMESLVLGEDD